MAQHTSAGARPYDTGLVLQARPEIDNNEFGMKQGTFRFVLNNTLWPAKEPVRATPCGATGFVGADSLTQSFLTGVSFMGAQTSRWTRGGHCPGVGILEVLCQGANFTQTGGGTTTPTFTIQSITISNKGVGYTSCPSVAVSGGGQISAANVASRLEFSTRDIQNGGTNYHVGDVLTFVGGTFDRPAKLRVDVLGTGGSIRFADGGQTSFVDRGSYSTIPTGTFNLSGGSGSGATTVATWRLTDSLVVIDGGTYTGTPSATLSGGGFTTAGTIGTVTMVNSGSTTSGPTTALQLTAPWKPVDTTKDTVQFTITGTAVAASTSTTVKYATTGPLPTCNYYTHTDGTIYIEADFASFQGGSPMPDGGVLSVGDWILVKDETRQFRNGIYKVVRLGSATNTLPVVTWVLARPSGYDSASNFTTALSVHVQLGNTLTNTTWVCAVNVTTLAPSDAAGGTNITFNSVVTSTTTVPQTRITIDYHAIELHFEYMANQKLQNTNFTHYSYSMDANGYITTDPSTGEKMLLRVDSALAENITIDATSGATNFTPTATPIPRSTWQQFVQFLGTAARFDQVPAGQYWHIIETTSIKIVPLNATPL